jgi:HSP90 family molecular chaperone
MDLFETLASATRPQRRMYFITDDIDRRLYNGKCFHNIKDAKIEVLRHKPNAEKLVINTADWNDGYGIINFTSDGEDLTWNISSMVVL